MEDQIALLKALAKIDNDAVGIYFDEGGFCAFDTGGSGLHWKYCDTPEQAIEYMKERGWLESK